MTSYKFGIKLFSAAVLTATVASGLISCSKKDPYRTGPNNATFYVDSVDGVPTNDPVMKDTSIVTYRKFINYTACVKDNAQQAAIMNLAFQIKAGDVAITYRPYTPTLTDPPICPNKESNLCPFISQF